MVQTCIQACNTPTWMQAQIHSLILNRCMDGCRYECKHRSCTNVCMERLGNTKVKNQSSWNTELFIEHANFHAWSMQNHAKVYGWSLYRCIQGFMHGTLEATMHIWRIVHEEMHGTGAWMEHAQVHAYSMHNDKCRYGAWLKACIEHVRMRVRSMHRAYLEHAKRHAWNMQGCIRRTCLIARMVYAQMFACMSFLCAQCIVTLKKERVYRFMNLLMLRYAYVNTIHIFMHV